MDSCTPIPCPPWQTVKIEITAVCDCQDHNTPGNPDCPIHGLQVQAWKDGYQAALDVLKHVHTELYRALPHYGSARETV